MTAEEYLGRPKVIERRIKRMQEHVNELKCSTISCTPAYGGTVVSHSRSVDTLQRNVFRISEAERDLEAEKQLLEMTKNEISSALRRIGASEIKAVLEAVCLQGLSMGKAGEQLGLSKHTVWSRYHRGIEIIEHMIREEQYA